MQYYLTMKMVMNGMNLFIGQMIMNVLQVLQVIWQEFSQIDVMLTPENREIPRLHSIKTQLYNHRLKFMLLQRKNKQKRENILVQNLIVQKVTLSHTTLRIIRGKNTRI